MKIKNGCLIVAALLSCNSTMTHAQESTWLDNAQFHGFLTQGYVNTSDNNWFGDSEDGSIEFTELGISAWVPFSPRFTLSGQLLSRRAGEMNDGSPRIDYGFASYQALNDRDKELGFRVGRIKNKIGLYNDTRDVAATRPGVFMPQSIYFDRIRNVLLSTDGVGTFGALHFPNSSLSLTVNVGEFDTDRNIKATFIGESRPGSITSDDRNITTNLLYEYDAGRIRVAFSNVDYTLKFNADPSSSFSNGLIDGDIRILSAEYNTEFWSFAGEYSRQPIFYSGISPLFEPLDGEAEAYYLQATHRFSHNWSSWVRYEASFRDKNDKDGETRGPASGLPAHVTFTKSWVLGVRWDINSDLMLSAEYQKNDGTFILSRVDNVPSTPTDPNWDIVSILISYRF